MLSTMASVLEESRARKPKFQKTAPMAWEAEEGQLSALVARLIAEGRENLSLSVEVEGKAYRISIEPVKRVPILHERW